MSDTTRDYVDKFWEMLDEFLNGILFLLIGFEMLIVHFSSLILWLGIICILIVLLARLISVAIPIFVLRYIGKVFVSMVLSVQVISSICSFRYKVYFQEQ